MVAHTGIRRPGVYEMPDVAPLMESKDAAGKRAARRTRVPPVKPIAEPEHALGQYLLWHEDEGHSRKTELVYQKTLRPFLAYLRQEHGMNDLAALTLGELRAWLVWLRNTPGPHQPDARLQDHRELLPPGDGLHPLVRRRGLPRARPAHAPVLTLPVCP
jgi:hypothetical protein